MKSINYVKLILAILMSVTILSACTTSNSGGSAMHDGKNAFGVPPSTWKNLTPAQQKQIIMGHMSGRRISKKTTKSTKTSNQPAQTASASHQEQKPESSHVRLTDVLKDNQ